MTRPFLVAVSQRVDVYPERCERRDALDQRLLQFFVSFGFIPVPVPNGFHGGEISEDIAELTQERWLSRLKPDAIVLSGGNDIGECKERDTTERHLLDYALTHNLPVLGICRGMQMMGLLAGADLVKVEGHVRTRHVLQKTLSEENLPEEVNSFHEWSLSNCPPGFQVIARSEHGEIEAIRHLHRPWLGLMWHPERESSLNEQDLKIIKTLFLSGCDL